MHHKREPDFSQGNGPFTWDRHATKYEPHTVPSCLDLKIRVKNSALASIEKDSND